jgi:murein DD-endopeptidase MepM/ murein hydrolase activator NlpD
MLKFQRQVGVLALTQWLGFSLATMLPLAARAQVSEVMPDVAPVAPEVAPINPVVEVPASVPPVVIDPAPIDPGSVAIPSVPARQNSPVTTAPSAPLELGRNRPSSSPAAGAYIDSEQYNAGATETPEVAIPAPQIVLNERTTGCQAVLLPGQALPASVCDMPARDTLAGRTRINRGDTLADAASGNYGNYGYGNRGQLPVAYPGSGRTFDLAAYLPRLGGGMNPLAWVPNGKQMRFPLALPAPLTSAFGWRMHPISGTWRFHNGVDIGAEMGAPVVAVYPGQVAAANDLGGYGLTVILNHPKQQWETLYAHLSEIFVQPGQQVRQGEIIGRVGSSGYSTGPHLHFEILQATENGPVAVNPGPHLQFAMAELIQALRVAQAKPAAKPNS